MILPRWVRTRALPGLAAVLLCATAALLVGQTATTPAKPPVVDAAVGFKEFSDRVQVYFKLRQGIESSLPTLKATDVPEIIAGHQQALGRKIKEARPDAKAGNLFTPAACEAFRAASRVSPEGSTASSLAYMKPDAPDAGMTLAVNGLYPDTAPISALSPVLLAAFPTLPAELVYRVVGRSLIVVDVKSNLVVDVARNIFPPA